MMATSARAAPSSGGSAASPGVSASSSQSERWGIAGETRGSNLSGGGAAGGPQDLCRGIGGALLGRLVEVDLDALPLVEMHGLWLVRERDASHRALHVDARQRRHD